MTPEDKTVPTIRLTERTPRPLSDQGSFPTSERHLAEAGRLFRGGERQAGQDLLEQINAASLAALAETAYLIAGYIDLVVHRQDSQQRQLVRIAEALETIEIPFLDTTEE